jgi:hypothetical protein
MRSKADSWKQKIDPAFDKIIKFYLSFLETLNLPSNEGYLTMQLPDKYLRKLEIEGFPSIASIYEHDKDEDVNFDFISMFDDSISLQDFKKITREVKKDENLFYESLMFAVEQLPEKDSREYYQKTFEAFRSADVGKIETGSPDEKRRNKLLKQFYSDRQSLQWHCGLQAIEHLKANIDIGRKRIQKKFKEEPKVLRRSIFFIWNTISLLVYKKSLKLLLNEARKEDDDALFKLIQIDKTLFDHEWLRARIRKASFCGDWKFFDNLSKAIKTDPLANRKIHGDIFLLLIHFWTVGLYRLTIPELIRLFKDSGVRMLYDEINFRKFVDREVKPLFKKWSEL